VNPAFSEKLRAWEEYLLILLIYLLPIHEASKNVVWGISVALLLVRHIYLRQWPPLRGAIGASILFWVFSGALSSCFAIEPAASLKGLWDVIRCAAGFWLVSTTFVSETSKNRFLKHAFYSTIIATIIAWYQLCSAKLSHAERAEYVHIQLPSVGHFNQSAIYLGMAWFITLAYCLQPQSNLKKSFKVFALLIVGLALLGTTARSTSAVAVAGTLLIILRANPQKWVLQSLGVILILGVISIFTVPSIKNRIFFHGSFHARVLFWESALKEFPFRPFTGVGLNNFKNIALETEETSDFGTVDHAHNLYFNNLAQTGITGAVAILALVSSAALALSRVRKIESPLVFRSILGVWLIAAVGGLSNTTIHHEMGLLFFLILGLMTPNACRTATNNKSLD
jgi:O-antigen ligase